MRSKFVSPLVIIALIVAQVLSPLNTRVFARTAESTRPDTITGTIIGRVLDLARKPIQGALVRVTNVDNGNVRAVKTGEDGWYQVPFLPLGKYSIEAFKDGFIVKEPNRDPIKVALGKSVEYAPPIFLIPVTSAPVAVTPPATQPTAQPAAGPSEEEQGRATNQEDATRRSNYDEQTVSSLPLGNIRSFDDLSLLAAGVAPPPQVRGVAGPGIGAGIGTAGQFSVNGQRARSNNFTVDGSDNNDEDVGVRRQGFVALVPQSIESVKEVQIVTHLWDAELGRSMGSQVNAVSKSGSKQVHGTAYDFFNHSALNARNFFDYTSDKNKSYPLSALAVDGYRNGQPINPRTLPVVFKNKNSDPDIQLMQPNPSGGKDQYQRNQGGGVIGFPVYRDKTFFFGSFERQDIKARQETHFAVPTIAQRGFLGRGATGLDRIEFTRDGKKGEKFPRPTSTAGDSIWSLFPFPNNPIGPYGGNTYTQILPADASATIYSLKFDHNFKLFGPEVTHAFTGRYNSTDDERQIPTVGGALFSGVLPRVRTHNVSLFLNSQFSPSKANQIRASYGRTSLSFRELRDPYLLPTNLPELSNEPFLLNAPQIENFNTLEGVTPLDPQTHVLYLPGAGINNRPGNTEDHLTTIGQVLVQPFSPMGTDVNLFPQARANNTIQFADTFNYFRAQHIFKFGADVRRTQLNSFLNRNFRSQVVFGGSPDLASTLQIGAPPIKNISQLGPTPGYLSGSDFASFGIPTSIFQSLAIGNADSTLGLRFWQFNFFANNNWRARRGLTLDYGLRYELNTTPRDVNSRIEKTFALDQIPQSDPTITITAGPVLAGNRPLPSAALLNSFNATLNALKNVIGNRDSIFETDRNNFGGHLGFAWDPFAANTNQAGKTSIRGGFGMYYDLTLGSVISQSRNVFPTSVPINIDANSFDFERNSYFSQDGGYFAIFNPRFIRLQFSNRNPAGDIRLITNNSLNVINVPPGALRQLLGLLFDPRAGTSLNAFPSGGGIAFTLPEKNLRSPYALQYNLQVERELFRNFLVNLAYVGSRGVKLTRFRTPNGGPNSITLPIDPLGIDKSNPPAIALPPLADLNSQEPRRPNPGLGAYTLFDSSAASSYHSMQLTATKRFSQGYQFGAAYTWSHALDDVSDVFDIAGAYVLPQDDRNLRAERASANFDIRHRFAFSSIGNLPFLAQYNDAKGTKGALLGGWQYSLFSTYQTGQPFTVNTSFDVNLDGNFTDRIDTLNGLTIIDSRGQKLGLNTNSVNLLAPYGVNGRIGRNFFRASGIAKTDLALIKNFSVREGQIVVLRVEAFNLGNRTHFAIPVRVLEAPSFGKSVDTTVGARQVQFGLKYVF